MKQLTLAALTLLAMSCTPKPEEKMTGAFRMLSQNMKTENIDSIGTAPQLKIYSDGYMMYAQFVPGDSIVSFGVGSVTQEEGGLKETNVYGAVDTVVYSNPPDTSSYVLQVERTEKGYRQVIPNMEFRGRTYELTEDYERVDNGITSPADGAWKFVSGYTVKGTDTTKLDVVQYKFYHSGSFIFGHTFPDNNGTSRAGLGFGTFTMSGDTALVENVEVSNYPIAGKSFNISVKVKGDELTQVVDELDGVKSVEVYRRM